jgi:glycolate oxidase FAD binding subunit
LSDQGDRLVDAVLSARSEGRSVDIIGSGSKEFLVRTPEREPAGRLLSTSEHTGIIDYRPDELVVTARTGTRLKDLRQTLAREGQMLPFEAPEFRGLGTLGGAVAAGLAGPGRPWRGAVRDSVLGVVMINGLGERLTFGGQVMKNVAGFDVSRLQAGAFGMFGVLLEVSLKVLPLPQSEETRVLELGAASALTRLLAWSRRPVPVSATAWHAGRLHVRLSGAAPAVQNAAAEIGGETDDGGFWVGLRDHALPFFRAGETACRAAAPAAALLDADQLVEWNGARRWTRAKREPFQPFGAGYARHRCRDAGGDAVLAKYQQRLKQAFDPDGIFNPELTHADLAA